MPIDMIDDHEFMDTYIHFFHTFDHVDGVYIVYMPISCIHVGHLRYELWIYTDDFLYLDFI